MTFDTAAILQAIAPGVALTSSIFYYGNLQERMIFTVEVIRGLNAEARALETAGEGRDPRRQDSLRWQVEFLSQRFRSIHRAMLLVYGGFFCFIATIIALLALGLTQHSLCGAVAVVAFGSGFLLIGAAALLSSREIRLSERTIAEDIASSFPSWDASYPRRSGIGRRGVVRGDVSHYT